MRLGDFAVVFDFLPTGVADCQALALRTCLQITAARTQHPGAGAETWVNHARGRIPKSQAAGSRDLNTQIFSLTLQYFLRLSLEGAVWASGSIRFLPVALSDSCCSRR